MDEISTTIGGIPCIARVTFYAEGSPATHWDPAEPEHVEFEILDRNGNPAAWLAAKATDADHARITTEILSVFNHQEHYE